MSGTFTGLLMCAYMIWAAVYNVICIPLAASGIINPSIAAAAMALSSNGVLLNALRLKKYEPRTI